MGRPQVPPQAPPIISPPNLPEPLNRSSLLRKRPGSRAISKRNVAISKLRWCRCKGAALSAYCPVSDPRYLWLTLGLKPIWAALSPWLMQEAMRAMVLGPDSRRVRMPAQGARYETIALEGLILDKEDTGLICAGFEALSVEPIVPAQS